MKKSLYILIIIISVFFLSACVKGRKNTAVAGGESSDAEHDSDKVTEQDAGYSQNTTENFSEAVSTEPSLKLNTVEALPDDGKAMTPAEALRSAMRGTRSLLRLSDNKQINDASEASDLPDEKIKKLSRVNLLTYNQIYDMGNKIQEEPINWTEFAWVDFNSDGSREVLVRSGKGGNYCVLYYYENELYMQPLGVRFVDKVWDNGIISGEGGSSVSYFRMFFCKGASYFIIVAESTVSMNYAVYRIPECGGEVSKEEYDRYLAEIIPEDTEPVVWYNLTDDNIENIIRE